ncbi:hypothetical protein [Paludibaculum fermentans]|uniref:Uncharacterized protein n=1 Tax=Paludibaculum fermentans TaxID=1473598 RepID=A0A7S7SK35_PALFE|nr:hypothetical protein [Paludibaculum fermentans]QOY86590.1 hypothetical protein IRI77_27925 [Paludibaculum fermentans]
MRITHFLTIDGDDTAMVARLEGLGLDLSDAGSRIRLRFFQVAEDDVRWHEVSRLLAELEANQHFVGRRIETSFTRQELAAADFLALANCWTSGYPEPSDLTAVPGLRCLPFELVNYDFADRCIACGMGSRQKAPFRMKKEPAWGRRSILKLNWVPDEVFVRRDCWEAVFRPFGVECDPVLHHQSGAVLETVVQLRLEKTASLHREGVTPIICTRCGRHKYAPNQRGPFPAVLGAGPEMTKTQEYFGHDGTAYNEILVTAALFESIRSAGLRGAEFRPCASQGNARPASSGTPFPG